MKRGMTIKQETKPPLRTSFAPPDGADPPEVIVSKEKEGAISLSGRALDGQGRATLR